MPKLPDLEMVAEFARAQAEGDILACHPPALAALLLGSAARIAPARERAVSRREGAVAVIPVNGMITNRGGLLEMFGLATSTRTLSRHINAAVRDPDVKAVLLDIDSPGGTVPGVDDLADEIFALRGDKPIVAQVSGMAASAAYWIAASADEIVAPEASYTGSIGVFSMHVDLSQALEEAGIKVSLIASSDEKVEEQPFVPLSESALAYVQSRVDHFDAMFTASVARGRGMKVSAVRGMEGRARVWPGAQALEMGLIDRIRPLRETLAAYGIEMSAPAGLHARGSAARRRRELGLMAAGD